MKSFFKSMAGRVFLILMGGIIASVALTATLASDERKALLVQIRNRHAAERVEQIVLTFEATAPEARRSMALAQKIVLHVELPGQFSVLGADDAEFTDILARRLGPERRVAAYRIAPPSCKVYPAPEGASWQACRSVLVSLNDGTVLRLDLPGIDRALPELHSSFLPYWVMFFICVALLAWLVARISTKPLRRLAEAANEFGRDIEPAPLPEQGPTEVAEAAAAFNQMQNRIRDFVHERTRILAAIAHDLQTPLTRLRLRLEKVTDEELRNRLIADLSATQQMVREGLELARSMDAEEPFEMLDLDSLLGSLVDDAVDSGQEVSLRGLSGGIKVKARPVAMRRCLTNLIENAVKYGGYAVVSTARKGAMAVISVADGGPGIPPEMLEKVFEPFYRLESSRSRDYGGTGLGLSIARNIAVKHGGTLTLRNLEAGGLEAVLELPLAGNA